MGSRTKRATEQAHKMTFFRTKLKRTGKSTVAWPFTWKLIIKFKSKCRAIRIIVENRTKHSMLRIDLNKEVLVIKKD